MSRNTSATGHQPHGMKCYRWKIICELLRLQISLDIEVANYFRNINLDKVGFCSGGKPLSLSSGGVGTGGCELLPPELWAAAEARDDRAVASHGLDSACCPGKGWECVRGVSFDKMSHEDVASVNCGQDATAQRVWFSYILEGPAHEFKVIESSVMILEWSHQYVDDLRKAIFAEVGKGLEEFDVKIAPNLALWSKDTMGHLRPKELLAAVFEEYEDYKPVNEVYVTPANASSCSTPFTKFHSSLADDEDMGTHDEDGTYDEDDYRNGYDGNSEKDDYYNGHGISGMDAYNYYSVYDSILGMDAYYRIVYDRNSDEEDEYPHIHMD